MLWRPGSVGGSGNAFPNGAKDQFRKPTSLGVLAANEFISAAASAPGDVGSSELALSMGGDEVALRVEHPLKKPSRHHLDA